MCEIHPSIQPISVHLWWMSWESLRDAASNRVCSNPPSSTWEAHTSTALSLPAHGNRLATPKSRGGVNVCKSRKSQKMKSLDSYSVSPRILKKHIPPGPRMDKWNDRAFSYSQWDFSTSPVTNDVAICLIILSEPQPNVNQPLTAHRSSRTWTTARQPHRHWMLALPGSL